MICPVCKSDMIVVDYDRIELDCCPGCHGVWFDAGELELLLDSGNLGDTAAFLDGIPDAAEAATAEKKRRCPICRVKMRKTNLEGQVLVDICPRGEGIWFDGGEMAALVAQLAGRAPAAAGKAQNVINFLGEVFKLGEGTS